MRFGLRIPVSIVAAVLIVAAAVSADCGLAESTGFAIRVDEAIRSMPEPFQGVVLVARKDRLLFARGYGLAERSARVVNQPGSRFLVGSVSKQFTAVLTLRLAQLGLIELDAPIPKYVPEYPRANGQRITVRHLLAHRSGIPHHAQGIPRYFDVVDRLFYTPREYLALFWNRPLLHEPGARFSYSSPGYTLLGVVLENATGRSYAELLREHVLTPLCLEHTSVDNNLTVQPDTATGYRRGLKGVVLARREEESTRGAAGSILTTAGDLARFHRVFSRTGDAVLDGRWKAVLLERHSPNYGFAGTVFSVPHPDGKNALTIVSHSGSSYGFMARGDRLIELDVSIIGLSNLQEADLGLVFDRVGDLVLEEFGIRRRKAAPAPQRPADRPIVRASTLASYEGFYALGDGSFVGILRTGETLSRLTFDPKSSNVSRRDLLSQGTDVFAVGGSPAIRYRFERMPTGEMRLTSLNAGNVTSTGTRIISNGAGRLSQYEGLYCSTELQSTHRFVRRGEDLVASRFLDNDDAAMTLLQEDVLGSREGVLTMERSEDSSIRGFWLKTGTTSSYFVRR